MLTNSRFWVGVVVGLGLYFFYTAYLSKKMKG